jgi:NDP-sugar pyrophosphorylase family protein
MEHVVRLLKRHGFAISPCSCIFSPGRSPRTSATGAGVHANYVTPAVDLGTAGAVKFAATFRWAVLVLSADVLTDFDLRAVVQFHRAPRRPWC